MIYKYCKELCRALLKTDIHANLLLQVTLSFANRFSVCCVLNLFIVRHCSKFALHKSVQAVNGFRSSLALFHD